MLTVAKAVADGLSLAARRLNPVGYVDKSWKLLCGFLSVLRPRAPDPFVAQIEIAFTQEKEEEERESSELFLAL